MFELTMYFKHEMIRIWHRFYKNFELSGTWTCTFLCFFLKIANRTRTQVLGQMEGMVLMQESGASKNRMNPDAMETLKRTRARDAVTKPYAMGMFGSAWYCLKVQSHIFCFNFLEDNSPFCPATDTPVLDFL